MDVRVVDGVVQPVGVVDGGGAAVPVSAGAGVDAAVGVYGGVAVAAAAAGDGVGWLAEREGLLGRVAALSGALDAERRRWAVVVADAHVWADENSLCGVFDEFCSLHGLPTREADFEVSVDVTVRVVVPQTARDADAACSEVQDSGGLDRVVQAIYDLARGDLDDAVLDWSVQSAEVL
ncbi:hypothetical protein [Mycobacteroides abscessus]|uniref:hypothetical protein n=1 Tax=Mycobacteroides abscessus TaxID=36809 RepID=UPI0018965EC1